MTVFIIVQSTYSTTRVGLYQNNHCLEYIEDIGQASTLLIPVLDALLKKHAILLEEISFIGAYQGPGPFTTLRVILASLNGISFARQIPLVGLDGLDALLEECYDTQFPLTIALLNAYNNDAYFGIQQHGKIVRKGYKNIAELLAQLQYEFSDYQLRFIGQGVDIFKTNIIHHIGTQAYMPSPIPLAPSLKILAQKAQQLWKAGKTTHQLLPLYLKTLKYKKSIT